MQNTRPSLAFHAYVLSLVIQYLDLSEFAAFLFVHFRHLAFNIRVVSAGVEVALIVF